MKRTLGVFSLSLFVIGCGGARGGAQKQPEPAAALHGIAPEQARWDELSTRYVERSFARDPGSAVAQGRHEFDGKVIDLSPEANAAWVAELTHFREEAEHFDAGTLDDARRFERAHLLAHVDRGLFTYTRLAQFERSPLAYADMIDPSVYVTREYAPPAARLTALIAHTREIPRVLAQMKTSLRTPLPRTFVDVGLSVFGGLGPYLTDDVPPLFASVNDPAAQQALREATTAARAALDDVARWLTAQKPTATDSFALGPELFREMLWAEERVSTPLDVLRAEGERDLQRNLDALAAACHELKQPVLTKCVDVVNADKPAAGPVAAAREQVADLRKRVADSGLVSIPGEEVAKVAEAPPYRRYNQAYIEIPGPYETNLPSTYYIAPPDPKWSREERDAYVPGALDLLFITVHEVWPGHFLQFLHANRATRKFGRLFSGYAFAEGWAHYAEELVWEEGLVGKDPKAHIAQLLNALLRNVRFLSAIGMHTEGMTVAESERMFREKALSDPGNARQQAARGTFDPGYLYYTMGKLMIRKLRDDWTRTRGGRAAYREFHDQLLSRGGPPLPLLREAMVGEDAGAL
ncbi:MAG: DUF885 domain-containing protein [Polyangiales bacterium]